jgi:hypothetical protein
MFKENIDNTGRVLRLIIAIVLFILAIWQHSWILAAFGVFTLIEAYFSWCVFYQLMGWNSCPIPKDKTKPKT